MSDKKCSKRLAEQYAFTEGNWCGDQMDAENSLSYQAFLAGWAARGKADKEAIVNELERQDLNHTYLEEKIEALDE